jgi:hypothetical protein
MDAGTLSSLARTLGARLEPLTGQVYFSPECHANYVALGFDPSPGESKGVALPDGAAYFTSRGSVMGQVSGEVVAAAFGVFSPKIVVPLVTLGWSRTDAATIGRARDDGGVSQLTRLLGAEPEGVGQVIDLLSRAVEPLRVEGRPLFAGLCSLPMPESSLGTMWRLGDMLREYRGDSHIAAWTTAGLTAAEIGLLTELYWGLPMRTYTRTRGWTGDEFDEATESLSARGLIDDSGFTDAGRGLRERIETDTDRQMAPAIDALGDGVDDLLATLKPWGATVRAGCGYPASGPHDLARAQTEP